MICKEELGLLKVRKQKEISIQRLPGYKKSNLNKFIILQVHYLLVSSQC